jgi:hypothetical protein
VFEVCFELLQVYVKHGGKAMIGNVFGNYFLEVGKTVGNKLGRERVWIWLSCA